LEFFQVFLATGADPLSNLGLSEVVIGTLILIAFVLYVFGILLQKYGIL
jgi:hypothetical protein